MTWREAGVDATIVEVEGGDHRGVLNMDECRDALIRGARPAPAGPFPPRKVTPPLAEGVPPKDWARTSFAVAP